MESKRLLIIGGGISGLAAAYYASSRSKELSWPLEIKVAEASSRFGGAIHTEQKNGFLIEHGPDSFATDKPALLELCQELGLENQLLGIPADCRKIYLRHQDRLFPIPQDFHLLAPAKLKTLFEMNFLSWLGRLRMAAELFIPPKRSQEDEGLGDFIKRRFGQETLDRVGQPFMGSIFGCDIRTLSLKATFPRFLKMEAENGSVIRGLQKMKSRTASSSQTPKPAKASNLGMFVTLRNGMSTLIQGLMEQTQAEWMPESRVTRIEPGKTWRVFFENGQIIYCDYLCLALPAFQAAGFFENTDLSLSRTLSAQPSKSMFVVHAAFEDSVLSSLPRAAGFVGTASTRYKIQGASFASFKFKNRALPGTQLIRIFTGYDWHPSFESLRDEKIGETIASEFCRFFKIPGDPISVTVSRHIKTMPHYRVGHLTWLENIENLSSKYPHLFLCGNSYKGASLPDCVLSAKVSAERILRFTKQEINSSSNPLPINSGASFASSTIG